MRMMWAALCLLLATAGCVRDEPRRLGNGGVQNELPRTNKQLGGGLPLFAATVVEGGGVRGSNNRVPEVVLDIHEELGKQLIPPGRIMLGQQHARFVFLAASQDEEARGFETPPNGTRIIAFGDAGPPLVVYANYVFADTEANRANVTLGRAEPESTAWQEPLFFASLGVAFIAIFLPWVSVTLGATAFALSIALSIGYESTIPRQTDIRVDLLLLVPVMLAAAISLLAAMTKRKPVAARSKSHRGNRRR
jgi:hypothetical protein